MLQHLFYIQDLDIVIYEMLGLFFCWIILMLVLKEKIKKVICFGAAILSVFAILLMTVFGRNTDEIAEISLIPFITFIKAYDQVEFYRSMLMNVCLFLPFGLSVPFALYYLKFKHNIVTTICCALILSVFIELVQFVFRLGICETDDIIMNFFGALIGSVSFIICKGLYEKKHHSS